MCPISQDDENNKDVAHLSTQQKPTAATNKAEILTPNQPQLQIHMNADGTVYKQVAAPAIENIVFEGGGVRGLGYAGGLKALHEKGIMQHVKRVAGSSAGALTALIVALGYSQEKADQVISGIDMGTLDDTKDLNARQKIAKLLSKGYINEGNILLELVRSVVRDRVTELSNEFIESHPDKMNELARLNIDYNHITFKNLSDLAALMPQANIKDLFITGTRLGKASDEKPTTVVFNSDETPDMEIALAARISASIPKFFQPIEIDGHLYVDGGCLSNFPLHIFERKAHEPQNTYRFQGAGGQNLTTLGLKIDTQKEMDALLFMPDKSKSLGDVVMGMLEQRITDSVTGMASTHANERMQEEVYWLYSERTCQLFDTNVGMVEFDLSDDKKTKIKNEGYKNVSDWIDNYLNVALEAKTFPSFADMCEAMSTAELSKFCDYFRERRQEVFVSHNPHERFGSPTDTNLLQQTANQILKKKINKQPTSEDKIITTGEASKNIKMTLEIEINKIKRRNEINPNPRDNFKISYYERNLKEIENIIVTLQVNDVEKAKKLLSSVISVFNNEKDSLSFINITMNKYDIKIDESQKVILTRLFDYEYNISDILRQIGKESNQARQTMTNAQMNEISLIVSKTVHSLLQANMVQEADSLTLMTSSIISPLREISWECMSRLLETFKHLELKLTDANLFLTQQSISSSSTQESKTKALLTNHTFSASAEEFLAKISQGDNQTDKLTSIMSKPENIVRMLAEFSPKDAYVLLSAYQKSKAYLDLLNKHQQGSLSDIETICYALTTQDVKNIDTAKLRQALANIENITPDELRNEIVKLKKYSLEITLAAAENDIGKVSELLSARYHDTRNRQIDDGIEKAIIIIQAKHNLTTDETATIRKFLQQPLENVLHQDFEGPIVSSRLYQIIIGDLANEQEKQINLARKQESFTYINLSGANLENSILRTDLRGANLANSNLHHSDLAGCELSNANLYHANLSGSSLPFANLHSADLTGANLDGSSLLRARLTSANLDSASLNKANLQATNLHSARFNNASMEDCILNNSSAEFADFSSANLSRASMSQAGLQRSTFNFTRLNEANLTEADLSHSHMTGCSANKAIFYKANLEQANLSRAVLTNANMQSAKLADTNMSLATMVDAKLDNANMSHAMLDNADLSNASLAKTKLRGASLVNANCLGANLENADLNNATIHGANFSGAKLACTNLDQVKLDKKLSEKTEFNKSSFFLAGDFNNGETLFMALYRNQLQINSNSALRGLKILVVADLQSQLSKLSFPEAERQNLLSSAAATAKKMQETTARSIPTKPSFFSQSVPGSHIKDSLQDVMDILNSNQRPMLQQRQQQMR